MNPDEKKIELNQLLRERFSDQDLRQICFDLQGVEYEDLSGTSRVGRILDLIIFLEKRGRLQEVVDWLVKNRSDVDVSMFQDVDWGSLQREIGQSTGIEPVSTSSSPAFIIGGIVLFIIISVGFWYWFLPSLPSFLLPTNTPTPLPPTLTFTPLPPTLTSTNTPVPSTVTSTFTPIPPTSTSTNTPTPPPPTPTLTSTPIPPTLTPTFIPLTPTPKPVDWRDLDGDGVLNDPENGQFDLCQDAPGDPANCGCPVGQVPSSCGGNNNPDLP